MATGGIREGIEMAIISVEVISSGNELDFKRRVKEFLDKNENMVFLDKITYGITQETRIDDEYGLLQGTMYTAIFQVEGMVKK